MARIFNVFKSGVHMAKLSMEDGRIETCHKDLFRGVWIPSDKEVTIHGVSEMMTFRERFEDPGWDDSPSVEVGGRTFERYEDDTYREIVFWVQRHVKNPVDIMTRQGRVIGFMQQNRENTVTVVEEGLEHRTPLVEWFESGVSPVEYDLRFAGHFSVPMKDGAKLATSVWLPKSGGKDSFPTILVRTPYGRERLAQEEFRYVTRGYALVVQDVRGREDSDGKWIPFAHEAEDGDATLNWIASQPWSDGSVGMIGASYGGFVQWAAASKGNPYLKAIVSIVTAGSPFGDVPRKGGAYMSGMLPWCFAMAEKKVDRSALIRDDWYEVIKVRPIKEIPLKALGKDIELWQEWVSNPDYNDFWRQSDWPSRSDVINVPSLIITGWYDDNFVGSMEAWRVMNRPRKLPSRLVVGAWAHDLNTTRDIHGVALGKNCLYYNIDLLHLRWFDRFLKGIPHDVEEPRVTYYELGSNQWYHSVNWPPEQVQTKEFHFSRGGRLSRTPEMVQDSVSYLYDPAHPAPHVLDMSENEMNIPGNYAQVEKRPDVITFTTDPLVESLKIAGSVKTVFYAASDAEDTDFVVRLLDVSPLGDSIKISQGVLRARYREGFDRPKLLEPGRIEKYEIQMDDVAATILPGHSLRVSITSSAHGFIIENSNSGHHPAQDEECVPALQTICLGGPYDSRIVVHSCDT